MHLSYFGDEDVKWKSIEMHFKRKIKTSSFYFKLLFFKEVKNIKPNKSLYFGIEIHLWSSNKKETSEEINNENESLNTQFEIWWTSWPRKILMNTFTSRLSHELHYIKYFFFFGFFLVWLQHHFERFLLMVNIVKTDRQKPIMNKNKIMKKKHTNWNNLDSK